MQSPEGRRRAPVHQQPLCLLHAAALQDSNQTASPPEADPNAAWTAAAWKEMALVAAFLYDLPDVDIAISRWAGWWATGRVGRAAAPTWCSHAGRACATVWPATVAPPALLVPPALPACSGDSAVPGLPVVANDIDRTSPLAGWQQPYHPRELRAAQAMGPARAHCLLLAAQGMSPCQLISCPWAWRNHPHPILPALQNGVVP